MSKEMMGHFCTSDPRESRSRLQYKQTALKYAFLPLLKIRSWFSGVDMQISSVSHRVMGETDQRARPWSAARCTSTRVTWVSESGHSVSQVTPSVTLGSLASVLCVSDDNTIQERGIAIHGRDLKSSGLAATGRHTVSNRPVHANSRWTVANMEKLHLHVSKEAIQLQGFQSSPLQAQWEHVGGERIRHDA